MDRLAGRLVRTLRGESDDAAVVGIDDEDGQPDGQDDGAGRQQELDDAEAQSGAERLAPGVPERLGAAAERRPDGDVLEDDDGDDEERRYGPPWPPVG